MTPLPGARRQAVPKDEVIAIFATAPVFDIDDLRSDLDASIDPDLRDPYEVAGLLPMGDQLQLLGRELATGSRCQKRRAIVRRHDRLRLAPDIAVQRQVAQPGVFGVADTVLAPGPAAVPQFQVSELAGPGRGGEGGDRCPSMSCPWPRTPITMAFDD